ncbi:hypothetical protein FE257_002313 [Aspergillus nanangensis]|uniref:BTB domain-containing protein n=1 Tax=Aspergillus nanangensis TaxID=2582783 RepID=A0AAD4GQ67_ASPNN|nr:hypothetical protein FE257_002313 [Aspergillus nanangensis]
MDRRLTFSTGGLLRNRNYSDLKLECDGHVFEVHKVIVCSQSPMLAAACNGHFQEGYTNRVHIEIFQPQTVRQMIEFFYMQEYAVDEAQIARADQSTREEPSVLLQHVRVNAIADYYGVTQLTHLATSKIDTSLRSKWSAAEFCLVTQETFKTTGDVGLQSLIALIASEHIVELLACPKFLDLNLLRGFSLNLVQDLVARHQDELDKLDRETQGLYLLVKNQEARLTALQTTVKNQEERLTAMQTTKDTETARANRVIRNINHCISILNRTSTCARCEDAIENELELMMDSQTSLQAEVDPPEDEITRYLAKEITAQSKQARQKRPRSQNSEPQDDEDDDEDHGLPLPVPEKSTQVRSGRIRKRPKLPAGFEIDKISM